MNIHKNARLTYARRLEMVRSIIERGLTPRRAALQAGESEPTARKWLGRYLAEGAAGLKRPLLAPQAQSHLDPARDGVGSRGTASPAPDSGAYRPADQCVQEHRGTRSQRARLSRLRDLEASEPVVR